MLYKSPAKRIETIDQRDARIAKARANLAAAYAANPDQVDRFNARMANLAAVRKRDRERVETLCLGMRAAPEPMPKKPIGMSKAAWKVEKARILKERNKAQAEAQRYLGRAGTPETLRALEGTHTGSLDQLEANGTITKDQREHAAQIANVYRSIESDVAVTVASLEARVDNGSGSRNRVAERIHRVRMHRAYTIWRDMLPLPKGLVLDMIVSDAIGYTVAATRYRVHKRKAKRLLLEAVNRWPFCVARAFSTVDRFMVRDMNEAIIPSWPAELGAQPRVSQESYGDARLMERCRQGTDEPYLLPAVDDVFLDERGYLKPWSEIADIVRERATELAQAA